MTDAFSDRSPSLADHTVGILGGTGEQGRGLAYRFAQSGVSVLIGSRDRARAEVTAAEIGLGVAGLDNVSVVNAASIVIAAVPWAGHHELLVSLTSELAGKIVVDCVNPLGFDEQGAFPLVVPEGSAAQQAELLLPESTVVAAFHHVSAVLLNDRSIDQLDGDILVLGDDRAATDVVQALADRITGMRGVYAGRLRNAHQIEAFTANLISVNRRYRTHAGVRLAGV